MKCRFCNYSKKFKLLVELANFPKAAQFFLKKKILIKIRTLHLKYYSALHVN